MTTTKVNIHLPNFFVSVESPFAAEDKEKADVYLKYARRCLYDSLMGKEIPFASHLLYTQEGVLDDRIPEERKLGLIMNEFWLLKCDAVAVYVDYDISPGMDRAIKIATTNKLPIFYRKIGRNND